MAKSSAVESPTDEEYVKYCEIDNVTRATSVDSAIRNGHTVGNEWVVTEKVHGTNFCYVVDDESVRLGKRNGWTDETFFSLKHTIEQFKPCAVSMFREVKQMMIDLGVPSQLKTLRIYGELYGGWYSQEIFQKHQKKVQNGTNYNPLNDFYAFDVHYTLENGENRWMKYDQTTMNMLEKHGFFYARPLFVGSFEQAMAYNQIFNTTIPALKNLPPLAEPMEAEGIVIKPVVAIVNSNGQRVIFKKKNELKFPEKTPAQPVATDADFPTETLKVIYDCVGYATEARLTSVISKDGFTPEGNLDPKTKYKFVQDCFKDFKLDRPDDYDNLIPDAEKYLKKVLSLTCEKMVKQRQAEIDAQKQHVYL
jgi:Rnl2 family RNA ligase